MSPLRWSRWGLLSFCWTASAWAAEGDDPAALFAKLDANKDGQLTAEEVPEEHRPHFERLLRRGDKDENKVLTKEEFLAAHAPDAAPEAPAAPLGPGGGRGNPGEFFDRLDVNKDGKLQKSEIPAQAPDGFKEILNRTFERVGKDELSREELMRAMGEGMRARMQGGGGPRPEGRPGQGRPGEGRPDGERRPGGPDGRGPEGDARRPREPGPDGRPGDGSRPGMDRGPGGPGGLMRLLDENHDGRLSRQEFAQAATFFADLDLNHDGSLDPSELMGPMPGGREMGPDGRGPRPDGDFRRDGNRGPDGERMRDGDQPGPRGEGDRRFGGDGPRPGEDGRARFGGDFNPDEYWKQLDKNGDGSVTKDEAPDRMKENFDNIDSNKDGKITQEEARAAMERRQGGRGPGGRPGRPDGERRPARPDGEEPKPEGDRPAGRE